MIPGSHFGGNLPHVGTHYLNYKEYQITDGTACPAEAGDVLFFNYMTTHGPENNRSELTRRNVLFQYRDASDIPTENVHFTDRFSQ
ncbi:phytanoyl-CoA dioxygenase family protein [Paenibacillus sp. OV219]|uniref:phytanoyl-CoA dioxygenase family protein n=1 Tax=Paenibacillus sp. OV219 TaxID=1884377 RepID=UPI003526CA25